jgi:hypothetical protein
VKLDTATVRELDVDGMLKALMVGAVVSATTLLTVTVMADEVLLLPLLSTALVVRL